MVETDKREVNISIPSELGYEKVVMAAVATVARKAGFPDDRIEDLKTAVGEACVNAIEHGNAFLGQVDVLITLDRDKAGICVGVVDNGKAPIPLAPAVLKTDRTDFRGMGLYLIQSLMDQLTINCSPGRNEIRMTSYLESS